MRRRRLARSRSTFGRRRPLRVQLALLLLLLPPLGGCKDRERPSPAEPGFGLAVELTQPEDGLSFYPGRINVRVHAGDPAGRLDGVAVTARNANSGALLDSVAAHFPPRADTSLTLRVQLPPVSSATGVELRGHATNASGASVSSIVRAVLVLPCPPAGCPAVTLGRSRTGE